MAEMLMKAITTMASDRRGELKLAALKRRQRRGNGLFLLSENPDSNPWVGCPGHRRARFLPDKGDQPITDFFRVGVVAFQRAL
jgi:hypothetical protein